MQSEFYARIDAELATILETGPSTAWRMPRSTAGVLAQMPGRDGPVLDFRGGDYLGLAGDSRVVGAAVMAGRFAGGEAGERRGMGFAPSPSLLERLEAELADYLGFEDAIVFSGACEANAGLFAPLLGDEDAVISDGLNNVAIVDGVRLSRAERICYPHGDMAALESRLRLVRDCGARTVVIATDGVFADGSVASLPAITALADRHQALVMVDDGHGLGVRGPEGRGSAASWKGAARVDILTGAFAATLGGGSGSFVAARRGVVNLLRQRARPYLHSPRPGPAACGAALAAIAIARGDEGDALRVRLFANAARMRAGLLSAGFAVPDGDHPMIALMTRDAALARRMADRLLDAGVLVAGPGHPLGPRKIACVRAQVTAAHTADHVDMAVAAFARAGEELGMIKGRAARTGVGDLHLVPRTCQAESRIEVSINPAAARPLKG